MFERRSEALLPRHKFSQRLLKFSGFSVSLIGTSLAIGMLGYHTIGGLPWLDAFLNASMILTGMGPVDRMETAPAKLFAAFYALFSGVVFLSAATLVATPFLHRFLHRFHLEMEGDDEPEKP